MSLTAKRIAILGARQASEEGLQFAQDVGALLAQTGAIVYCGGAQGIMEAASRGVSQAGGTVVGILKESDEAGANAFISIPVMTGMGDLRNGIIARSVHGAIAVEGAYGTLSEIAYMLGYDKPVLGFNTWEIPGLEPVGSPQAAVQRILSLLKEETHV